MTASEVFSHKNRPLIGKTKELTHTKKHCCAILPLREQRLAKQRHFLVIYLPSHRNPPSLSLRVSAPGFSCLHDPDAVDPDAAADVLFTLPPPFWHRAGERDGVVVSELIFLYHFVTL